MAEFRLIRTGNLQAGTRFLGDHAQACAITHTSAVCAAWLELLNRDRDNGKVAFSSRCEENVAAERE